MFPDLTFSPRFNFSNWVSVRHHWKKNRVIFKLIFINMLLPLKFLKIAEKMKKIDLNLIFAWKKLKYLNLCSTVVIQQNTSKKEKDFICRKPLVNRNIRQIFFIEKSTGCICCTTDTKKYAPIWWDEWGYIPLILNHQITRILLYRFHGYSLFKKFNSIDNNDKFSLKKLSKVSDMLNIYTSLCFSFSGFFQNKSHFKFTKKWYLIF